MPLSAGSVHPSYLTFMGVNRELTTATVANPAAILALDAGSYDIEDTPRYLPDTAIRGSMTFLFNEIKGPQDATFSFGGPAYLDIEGYLFDNMFGDLSSTGTAAGSTTTIATQNNIGDTTLTVNSIAGFSNGGTVQIGTYLPGLGVASTQGPAEVVILSAAPAGSTLTFANNPLRFVHTTGGTVSVVTGPFTHWFATTNQGSGQPPTHTLTDYTGVTPSTGARNYVSACTAQLDLSGNAEQLLMWKVTGSAWTSTAASTKPSFSSQSFVIPVANWRGSVSIGGTPAVGASPITGGTIFQNIGEWSISFKRKLQIYWTAQGSPNPYFIARGPMDVTGTVDYTVAQGTDESPLTNMLNNAYLPVNVTIDNGQTGTNNLNISLTTSQVQFVKAKPVRNAELVAYQDEFQAVGNSYDVGGSGGLGAGTIQLKNNYPTY